MRTAKEAVLTEQETEAFVKAELEGWKHRLGLSDWRVSVSLKPLDRCIGTCDADFPYKAATIVLDPAGLTPENVRQVLVHELLHCVESPYRTFFRQATCALGQHEGPVWDMLNDAFQVCAESTVRSIEKILHRNGVIEPRPARPLSIDTAPPVEVLSPALDEDDGA